MCQQATFSRIHRITFPASSEIREDIVSEYICPPLCKIGIVVKYRAVGSTIYSSREVMML
jgi:hypothetical protein